MIKDFEKEHFGDMLLIGAEEEEDAEDKLKKEVAERLSTIHAYSPMAIHKQS